MFNLNKYEYFEDINLGLIKYIPKNRKILDVGCGSGLLGKFYKKNNNIIFGIDSAQEIQKKAIGRLNKFFLSNITDFNEITKLLGNNKFDVIIFADVLEHLYDPMSTLLFYKRYLKKGGLIYLSVPNIAVWYTRINLLFGNFTYTETGTLDKTHIRFFTKNNIKILCQKIKMKIINIDITPGIARFFIPLIKKILQKKKNKMNPNILLESPFYKFYSKYIYPIEYFIAKLFPGFFAFQYIIVIKM